MSWILRCDGCGGPPHYLLTRDGSLTTVKQSEAYRYNTLKEAREVRKQNASFDLKVIRLVPKRLPATKEGLEKAIAELGTTTESCRAKLAEVKTKAVCGDARKCAIADYLHNRLNLAPDQFVHVSSLTALIGKVAAQGSTHYDWNTEVPHGQKEFIRSFDDGKFPELVLE